MNSFYERKLDPLLILKIPGLWMFKLNPFHIAKILDVKCKTIIAVLNTMIAHNLYFKYLNKKNDFLEGKNIIVEMDENKFCKKN